MTKESGRAVGWQRGCEGALEGIYWKDYSKGALLLCYDIEEDVRQDFHPFETFLFTLHVR